MQRVLIAGVLVGLAACVDSTPAPPLPFQPGVFLATDQASLEKGTYSKGFDFSGLRSLWVRVLVERPAPTTFVSLAFLTPSGERFFQMRSPYSTDGLPTMMMPGIDHPMSLIEARRVVGGYALDRAIPVAGSVFAKHPVAGTWLVVAEVEGKTYSTEMQVSVAP